MRDLLLLSWAFLCVSALSAQNNFSHWTPDQVISQANLSGQYIFVSFEANWCQPCHWMKENIYSDRGIQQKLTNDFLYVRADITSDNVWSARYDVKVLPYAAILDQQGSIVASLTGIPSTSEMIDFLNCRCQVKSTPEIPDATYTSWNESSLKSEADKYWTVQVGKYVGSYYAGRMKGKIEDRFEDVHLVYEKDRYGRDIYRVFVGYFLDERSASYTLDQLQDQGYKGIIKFL